MEIQDKIKGKTILITGGTGSLGYKLTEELSKMQAKEIRIFSRSEKGQDAMKKIFPNCKYILGDVRDYNSIRNAIRKADIIYHAAAMKYITLAEEQPDEAIKSNILGSLNVLEAVKDEKDIELCIGISTDKACAPINVYGMSKATMERLFCHAHKTKGNLKTVFAIARYGNVVGTNGSVIPLWKERVDKGQDLLITNPNMTRFLFTLLESLELIFYTTLNAKGGEIISKEMPAVLLGDLAKVMSKNKDKVIEMGLRPGEKMDETLIADFELKDTLKKEDKFILIPHSNQGINKEPSKPFTSDIAKRLNNKEIKNLLKKTGFA